MTAKTSSSAPMTTCWSVGIRRLGACRTASGRSIPGTKERSMRFSSTAISTALVVHPALAQPELDHRDRQDDDEESPGKRRRVAQLEVLERLLEQIGHVHQR